MTCYYHLVMAHRRRVQEKRTMWKEMKKFIEVPTSPQRFSQAAQRPKKVKQNE